MKPPTKAQWAKWMAAGELPTGVEYWIPGIGPAGPFADGRTWETYSRREYLAMNAVCRTKTEAIAKAKRMLAAIKED